MEYTSSVFITACNVQKEEEEEDNRLSEEAERYFEDQQCNTSGSSSGRRVQEPETNQPHQVNHDTLNQVNHHTLDQVNHHTLDPLAPAGNTINVPAIVTST